MTKRYELPDAVWELITDLVSPKQKMGQSRSDDRLMLNGILWVLCSGAAWRDLPERFGPWSTVYQRFRDWRDDGTFDQWLERLHIRLNQEGLINLDTWVIDSTAKYRQRNIIERMFSWLKKNRRIGTRYDKLARSFAAMVTLVCTLRCLRQYFSYRT